MRQHPRRLSGPAPWAWVPDSGVAGLWDQEEGLQELLGRWKAWGKNVRPKMILETTILSADILGVAWQIGRVPGVDMTSTEFQTPHQITGQTWASLGLSFPT